MGWPFLYDTHYQVNRPFALLDLTLATASPTAYTTDDVLARRLESRSTETQVQTDSGPKDWQLNKDALRYWIDNCHDAALLSRQNAYDYWLMNFRWIAAFSGAPRCWGRIEKDADRLARLLLFRWAWCFDAPMLSALLWRMDRLGTCDMGELVNQNARHIEDVLSDVFAAIRESFADPRERTIYRQKIEEVRRGFKYNTRRHKVVTHLAILAETGLIVDRPEKLHAGIGPLMRQFESGQEAATSALRAGSLGTGSELFLELAENVFALPSNGIGELGEAEWGLALPEIQSYWREIERWDRKFLGIQALAELFVVKNLEAGRPLWSPSSWRDFLAQRARFVPEELTTHVDRFGRIEYLRLSDAKVPG